MSVLTRLEIDVMVVGELQEAAQLANKYHLPGLVVHPGLAAEGHIARGRNNGKFKIFTPIDLPKGENYGNLKLRGLSTDALEADGFEIILTPNKNLVETRNEAKLIHSFIRNHLGPTVEIRFVLNTLGKEDEQILIQSEALRDLPTPAFIRNDMNVKSQVGKANPEIHNHNIELVHNKIKVPIKIAGNITGLKQIAACRTAKRFGVSLLQAKQIIKEFNNHPQMLKELLVD
jgi:deoxyribose-phosphate aldolase